MPNAEAQRITAVYRQRSQGISADLEAQVGRAWSLIDPANVDKTWPAVLAQVRSLVARGYGFQQALAAAYLKVHANASGVRDLRVQLGPSINLEQVDTSLRVTGPVALKIAAGNGSALDRAAATALTQLAGASNRLSQEGGRSTIDRTATASDVIVGYRRETRAHSCYFCAMLASRGSVYKSKGSALTRDARGGGSKRFHDHCHCTVEPLYGHEDEPENVAALSDRWASVTAGKSGDDAVNAWRAAYSA